MCSVPCMHGHVNVDSFTHLLMMVFGDSPLLDVARKATVVSGVFLHSLTQHIFIQRLL